MEYNFSKMWSSQFFSFYNFKSFYEYASDKESQIDYYKSLGAVSGVDGKISEIETPQELIDAEMAGITSTLEMIKNQIIVFLFTRYEFIMQETVECLFVNDPQKILKFISVYPDYEKFIGFSLTEFIETESKMIYIKMISKRLSAKVLSGKPSKVIKRLKCLLDFRDVNIDLLDELMYKRNNIIHENKVYIFTLDELEEYYESIEHLLKNLALALQCINICVIDNGSLLSD